MMFSAFCGIDTFSAPLVGDPMGVVRYETVVWVAVEDAVARERN
jgi:hypothetical protein